ncbi:MAG: hypothetical protein ACYCZ1_06190 [Candidatus Humimicrobiaceae bacterium]
MGRLNKDYNPRCITRTMQEQKVWKYFQFSANPRNLLLIFSILILENSGTLMIRQGIMVRQGDRYLSGKGKA